VLFSACIDALLCLIVLRFSRLWRRLGPPKSEELFSTRPSRTLGGRLVPGTVTPRHNLFVLFVEKGYEERIDRFPNTNTTMCRLKIVIAKS
jgi:hypothetical protein